jgi:hypothetical protein
MQPEAHDAGREDEVDEVLLEPKDLGRGREGGREGGREM